MANANSLPGASNHQQQQVNVRNTLGRTQIGRELDQREAQRAPDYLTELLVSKYCKDLFSLVLPILSHQVSCSGRQWVTLISSQRIKKSLLWRFGVDPGKIRYIAPSEKYTATELAELAIAQENSHCVLALDLNLNDEERGRIERTAQKHQCTTLVVTTRD